MLFKYLEYPSQEDTQTILLNMPILDKLILTPPTNNTVSNIPNISDINIEDFYFSRIFEDWLVQFNNRLGKVRLTYTFLAFYYNKGIPDEPYFVSPGPNGESIKYFPEFEEKHYYYRFTYNYYSEFFYYLVFTVIDSIYHLLNTYYRMNIQIDKRFEQEVLNELKKQNINLYNFFGQLIKKTTYIQAQKFRNDFTHNFPPNQLGHGIEKLQGVNIQGVSIGVGNYTPIREFQTNTCELLKILETILRELETHLI